MQKPKKLVLYSGGQNASNKKLHTALVDLMGRKKRKRMTYIPFCTEGSEVYYRRFIRRYKSFGVTDFHILPIDGLKSPKAIAKALNGDGIYLAGGNTYYFLHHLQKSGLLRHLRKFVREGGVLAGLSAGAIMMTPHIEMAGFPPYDQDENDVGLENLCALNLVNFEFLPHFEKTTRMIEAMQMYSVLSPLPIFACQDGGGIVIDGHKKSFYGEVNVFFKGHLLSIDHFG